MKLGNIAASLLPKSAYRKLSRVYMRVRLFGNTYQCPICGRSSSKFYSAGFTFPVLKEQEIVGGGFRENIRCPNCGSADRERLVYLYLKNKAHVDTARFAVLHVAPEVSLQRYLKGLSNITHESIDIGSPHADKHMDLRALEYADGLFDIVICNHVLEHIQDDHVAMGEILRVLKPNGFAILQVPISLKLKQTFEDPSVIKPEDRERVFGQNDHIRIYARDYKDRLVAAGFSVEVLDYQAQLGEALARKYALDPKERLYIAHKPA